MDKIIAFLDDIGVSIALIIAGVFGGILSLSNKKELNGWEKTLVIVSGGAIANYLTPLIFSYIDINENTKYGFAFLLGYSGLEGVKWIILKLKLTHKKDE